MNPYLRFVQSVNEAFGELMNEVQAKAEPVVGPGPIAAVITPAEMKEMLAEDVAVVEEGLRIKETEPGQA